jgi:hypothetical protein
MRWRFDDDVAGNSVMVAIPIEAAQSEKDPDGEGERVQYTACSPMENYWR